jgi:hypothetical protein
MSSAKLGSILPWRTISWNLTLLRMDFRISDFEPQTSHLWHLRHPKNWRCPKPWVLLQIIQVIRSVLNETYWNLWWLGDPNFSVAKCGEIFLEFQAARALEAALVGDPSGFFGAWPWCGIRVS